MADTSAQADIRGLDIDKLARGFADEVMVMKKHVRNSTTKAREIRWYQKTAGFLDSTDTTAITASQIWNTSAKSLPVVVEQSWTRNTSYVKKFFVESPWLSEEDIKDSDVDLLATNIRDLVRAVANQVDIRIYNVVSDTVTSVPGDGGNVQTGAAKDDGWDDPVTGDPITDIMDAKKGLRAQNYDPEGAVMLLEPTDHANLVKWLINVKGSSIPNFASERVRDGVVMEILGVKVVVNSSFTTDYAVVFVPQVAATWKSFMPISTAVVKDPGIGRKIRVWEEGECLLTDPNAVYVITDTQV